MEKERKWNVNKALAFLNTDKDIDISGKRLTVHKQLSKGQCGAIDYLRKQGYRIYK